MDGLQVAMMRARICPHPTPKYTQPQPPAAVLNESQSDVLTSILARLSALEAKLSTPVNGCGQPTGAPKPRPTVASIKQIICAHYHLLETELISQMRSKDAVWARQVTMYLCARYTMQSLPSIGRLLGGRDHTTVLHGRNKVAVLRAKVPAVQAELDSLEAKITA